MGMCLSLESQEEEHWKKKNIVFKAERHQTDGLFQSRGFSRMYDDERYFFDQKKKKKEQTLNLKQR